MPSLQRASTKNSSISSSDLTTQATSPHLPVSQEVQSLDDLYSQFINYSDSESEGALDLDDDATDPHIQALKEVNSQNIPEPLGPVHITNIAKSSTDTVMPKDDWQQLEKELQDIEAVRAHLKQYLDSLNEKQNPHSGKSFNCNVSTLPQHKDLGNDPHGSIDRAQEQNTSDPKLQAGDDPTYSTQLVLLTTSTYPHATPQPTKLTFHCPIPSYNKFISWSNKAYSYRRYANLPALYPTIDLFQTAMLDKAISIVRGEDHLYKWDLLELCGVEPLAKALTIGEQMYRERVGEIAKLHALYCQGLEQQGRQIEQTIGDLDVEYARMVEGAKDGNDIYNCWKRWKETKNELKREWLEESENWKQSVEELVNVRLDRHEKETETFRC